MSMHLDVSPWPHLSLLDNYIAPEQHENTFNMPHGLLVLSPTFFSATPVSRACLIFLYSPLLLVDISSECSRSQFDDESRKPGVL